MRRFAGDVATISSLLVISVASRTPKVKCGSDSLNGTLKHLTPECVGLKNDLYTFEENGVETDKVEVFLGE